MRCHQGESNNQGFTVCVIMCGSQETRSTGFMQMSAWCWFSGGNKYHLLPKDVLCWIVGQAEE